MYEGGQPLIDHRMYHPEHPWSAIVLDRHAQHLRGVNTDNPTLVELLEDGYDSRIDYAFHPYLIIVHASFLERLNPCNYEQFKFISCGSQRTTPFSIKHHIVGSPIINEHRNISVIEVDKPV